MEVAHRLREKTKVWKNLQTEDVPQEDAGKTKVWKSIQLKEVHQEAARNTEA